jgi:MFS family permease
MERTRAAAGAELYVYYGLIALYFFAFGLQFVLFPALVTFVLKEPPARVGLAQMALSAPMFLLLLVGGLLAERQRAGRALAWLQGGIALASVLLAVTIYLGALSYPLLMVYAVFVGSCAALMGPSRDSALNGVVERVAQAGRSPSIASAAALTTSVQIGAQIAGIVAAREAGDDPASLLLLQGAVLVAAAGVALLLRAPKPAVAAADRPSAIADVREGLIYAFRNPVMGPMMISALYSGVFIIGSFQVLFPLIIREEYGGAADAQANLLSVLFASFWAASFVSAVILARMRPLQRPGRAMLAAHMLGAVALLTFAWEKPFSVLTVIVIFWGLAAGVWISMSRTIAQSAAEPRYLGRVLAIYAMGFMGGAPIGSALTGFAAAQLGPHFAALIPGFGLLFGAAALALFTTLWKQEFAAALRAQDPT